jgi:hypothetical protein
MLELVGWLCEFVHWVRLWFIGWLVDWIILRLVEKPIGWLGWTLSSSFVDMVVDCVTWLVYWTAGCLNARVSWLILWNRLFNVKLMSSLCHLVNWFSKTLIRCTSCLDECAMTFIGCQLWWSESEVDWLIWNQVHWMSEVVCWLFEVEFWRFPPFIPVSMM